MLETKVLLYHGTSVLNAESIIKNGFSPAEHSNWKTMPSIPGMIYLSDWLAPFYAINMGNENNEAAIIKVEVLLSDLLPDEDYIFQREQIKWNSEFIQTIKSKYWNKQCGLESLNELGNVSVYPHNINIIGKKIITISKYAEDLYDITPGLRAKQLFEILGYNYKEYCDRIYNGESIEKIYEEKNNHYNSLLQETEVN